VTGSCYLKMAVITKGRLWTERSWEKAAGTGPGQETPSLDSLFWESLKATASWSTKPADVTKGRSPTACGKDTGFWWTGMDKCTRAPSMTTRGTALGRCSFRTVTSTTATGSGTGVRDTGCCAAPTAPPTSSDPPIYSRRNSRRHRLLPRHHELGVGEAPLGDLFSLSTAGVFSANRVSCLAASIP
ncbi:MORN1 isoform 7, partial [Pan troglodytes]